MATGKTVLGKDLQSTICTLSDEQLASLGLMRIETAKEPPECEIIPEIACAAKWWAERLKAPQFQDNGDPLGSILSSLASDGEAPLRPADVARFERWLAWTLQKLFTTKQWPGGSDCGWNTDNPQWGSAVRSIYNDYGPDYRLVVAAQRAGIYGTLSNRFPIKTCMWINPGSVKVRWGYGAKEQELFKAAACEVSP